MLEVGFGAAAWCFQKGHDVRFMVLNSSDVLSTQVHYLSYSYLGTLPMLVIFSVAMTVIKFREGQHIMMVWCGLGPHIRII